MTTGMATSIWELGTLLMCRVECMAPSSLLARFGARKAHLLVSSSPGNGLLEARMTAMLKGKHVTCNCLDLCADVAEGFDISLPPSRALAFSFPRTRLTNDYRQQCLPKVPCHPHRPPLNLHHKQKPAERKRHPHNPSFQRHQSSVSRSDRDGLSVLP